MFRYFFTYGLTYLIPFGLAAIVWNTTHNEAATGWVLIPLTILMLGWHARVNRRR